jgi:hypothetical protein
MNICKYLMLLVCTAVTTEAVRAQVPDNVWQWAVDVPTTSYSRGNPRAYLWIPENCEKVNAIVFAQHNMEEIQIMQDSNFRKALAEMGVAQVWCSPAWDLQFHFNEGAGDIFRRIMNDLADKSGYTELCNVPVVYMGHSAAASAPYYFAAWNPERTLAAISVSGQWPYVRNEFAPDIWGDKTVDFIPCLETMGEYENAVNWSATGLKDKAAHPKTPLSMLACPAEGHFASTPEKTQFIAFYIKKAMQYRMPVKPDKDGKVKLRPIDPEKTGWLADKWRGDTPPIADPAPINEYKGDPKEAFWFFDREHALRTQEYQSRYRKMSVQLLGYEQNGELIPQKDIHLQVPVVFLPDDDGVSFTLNGVFMDTVPGGSPRPARWAQQPVGSAIGHPASKELIDINVICGPVRKLSSNRFILDIGRNEIRNARYSVAIAATHQGDASYKPMVQQAEIIFPEKLTEGRKQTVTFPEISDVKYGHSAPIELNASSDSGMKIYYYVTEGPAVVEGNTLLLTTIPPRSRFPIIVSVEAWQYGSNAKRIQTAEKVVRTFYITKNQQGKINK